MSKVIYSAVVLDDESRTKLLNQLGSIVPKGWDIIAHHMTINLGEIKPEYKEYIGDSVELHVDDIGFNEKVIAVGVSGFYSNNSKPHVTLAVNRKKGGKPVMSNDLTNWNDIPFDITLSGTVMEVKSK